ncbi:TlpA family protein disulfide reductase [Chryseobacterium indoltheticum]|uniref:TlpA family protein disulfide reductase n=1 Tax=Chryseobacterium indoltheticum TaxID=254 RepID=UPI003F4931D0
MLNKNYKKHLVIFWASWCGPCRQEIPLLKKVYSESNKEIEFVSVSIDNDKKSWKRSIKY